MGKKARVVHYLNQFFAGLGGEEAASLVLQSRAGAAGLGLRLQALIQPWGDIVATLIGGDNYVAEKGEDLDEEILRLISVSDPDLLIAGPAFNSGRYGYSCGLVCSIAGSKMKIPTVTAMFPENTAVELFRKQTFIVKTTETVRGMDEALTKISHLAQSLISRGPADPETHSYIRQGRRRNIISPHSVAERAVEMLLKKVAQKPFKTELELPSYDRVAPPPPLASLKHRKLALISESGVVPKGNPDRILSTRGDRHAKYPLNGLNDLSKDLFESVHGGYSTGHVNEDPDRAVPLDALRELEKEGVFGKLHESFYATVGCGMPVENARRIGSAIAQDLIKEGAHAALITST